MRKLSDLDVTGRRVFVRADLDVDVAAISNPNQIVRLNNLKATIDYLVEHEAKQIVIAGHIGRPTLEMREVESQNGRPPLYNKLETTEQLVEPLKKILGRDVAFCADFGHVNETQIILFENLRFWPGEVANDQVFANKLAMIGQVYVNDAFGNCHREHASMVKLPELLPHAAGLQLQKEIEKLTQVMMSAAKPFVAVVGGFKKETKLPVIVNLAKLADRVLVGGALVKELATDAQITTLANVSIATLTPDGEDLDEKSIAEFKEVIAAAKTIVWNGPLGHFETGHTAGSMAVVESIGVDAYSVVGGGETTEFLAKNNLIQKFSFVSSGGGAMLEFLAGKKLPGIEALA